MQASADDVSEEHLPAKIFVIEGEFNYLQEAAEMLESGGEAEFQNLPSSRKLSHDERRERTENNIQLRSRKQNFYQESGARPALKQSISVRFFCSREENLK